MKKILVDVEGGVESFANEAQVDTVEVRDTKYMHGGEFHRRQPADDGHIPTWSTVRSTRLD